jgi:catechol 2,3-dioxygenase-like lactoylglutathione lyase family enzyme
MQVSAIESSSQASPPGLPRWDARWYFRAMAAMVEKISAITFRTANMKASVQFYSDVLGMELLYGGEQASFSSLRTNDNESAILNLEQGDTVTHWGRLIFHVADVDALWRRFNELGFKPEKPQNASWGDAPKNDAQN